MEKIKEKKYIDEEIYELENQEDLNEDGIFSWENALMALGFLPVVGEIADIILIIKYWREKRKIEAGLMLFALIPTVGDVLVKPFLKLGKAAGAFKTSGTFLKFLSENPAARASYAKIGKQMDNPVISKLIGQVDKVPGAGTALKNAQNLHKGIFSKIKTQASSLGSKAMTTMEKGVGNTVKQNFQNLALQKYLINTGGKAPSNFLSRWWNVTYGGRMERKNLVKRLIMGSNVLGAFGFPNIESFDRFMSHPEDNPQLAEKLMKDPEFAKIYNQATSDEERASLENAAQSANNSGGGIIDKAGNALEGMVGLSLLKSFARFV